MPSTPLTIKGYHGTDMALVGSIKQDNFYCSQKPEWLGKGAYFFTDGVSFQGPDKDAIEWAEACVRCFGQTYQYWAVMTADLQTDKMLDLTDERQLKIFNKMRDVVYKRFKIRPRTRGAKDKDWILDVEIIDMIRGEMEILAAKSHFFFKFTLENRHSIGSRIPNVTVVCVYAPDKVIDKSSIQNPHSGLIR